MFAIVLTLVLGVDPVPAEVKSYFEHCERDRRAKLQAIREQVPELEKKLKSRKTVLEARQRIAELHEEMEKLLNTKPYYATLTSLEVGSMGSWPAAVKVFQVVGPEDMICKFKINRSEELVWLSGISTTNLADDDRATIPEAFMLRVIGNKSYTTALGSRKTIMHVKAQSVKDYSKQGEAIQAALK